MDNDMIVAQLKRAQESRSLGYDAYAQGYMKVAGEHFLRAHEVDIENWQLLGDTPLILQALATDLMGLRMSLRETSGEEEVISRELHSLNMLRREIEGDTPKILGAITSNLLRLADLAKGRGDIVEAEQYYRERQALNLRRQGMLGDNQIEVLGDLVIDLERLGDLAWEQGDFAEAKRYYFVNAMHLINMPTRNFEWTEYCVCIGQRLILLATAELPYLPEVLTRMSLLSKALVEYLDLELSEVFEHALDSFAKFHSDYLELAVKSAPDRIPVILPALQTPKLATSVMEVFKTRLQDYSEDPLRHRFFTVLIELRRLSQGLEVIEGDRDNELPHSDSAC